MHELWRARESVPPSRTFSDVSLICENLNIQIADCYGDFGMNSGNSWLRKFESEACELLGKADSVFMPSGVMAQEIALCIYAEKELIQTSNEQNCFKPKFLAHHSSHVLLNEENGYSKLLGMNAMVVKEQESENGIPLPITFEGFRKCIAENGKPFAAIIECPHRELGGVITPIEDIKQISDYCRKEGIKLHMDGARLWEATAAYCNNGLSLQDFCSLFDSIYVSFYKGLGAPFGGAMLFSNDVAFCADARLWLRRFGGNVFSLMPYAATSFHAMRVAGTIIPTFVERTNRLQLAIESISKALSSTRIQFCPPVPVVPLIHVILDTSDVAFAMSAHQAAVARSGVSVFARLRQRSFGSGKGKCYFEFNMGPLNITIPIEHWVSGYVALLVELNKG